MERTSLNSESAYEVDSTPFTFDEKGVPWLRLAWGRGCAEDDVGSVIGDGKSV